MSPVYMLLNECQQQDLELGAMSQRKGPNCQTCQAGLREAQLLLSQLRIEMVMAISEHRIRHDTEGFSIISKKVDQ